MYTSNIATHFYFYFLQLLSTPICSFPINITNVKCDALYMAKVNYTLRNLWYLAKETENSHVYSYLNLIDSTNSSFQFFNQFPSPVPPPLSLSVC